MNKNKNGSKCRKFYKIFSKKGMIIKKITTFAQNLKQKMTNLLNAYWWRNLQSHIVS